MDQHPLSRQAGDHGRALGRAAMVLAVGVSLGWLTQAWAGPPTEQLKASVDNVIRILENPGAKSDAKARRASIRREADNIFDMPETAKRALGTHWQKLGARDREEFVSLFADLLERAYVSKIERYSGERITYAGEAGDGELVTVKTRFITKQGTEVPVDYRMLRQGDRWRAYDVVIEGVSLVANYRSQFDKIIQTTSYGELVSRMKNGPGALNSTGVKRKDSTPGS